MAQYLRIACVLLFGLTFGGCPPAPEVVQPTPPENLGIVINKFCNGFVASSATGDTIELLVTQKALDARGVLLKDFSPKSNYTDFDNGGGFIFNETQAMWNNIRGGTFIVLKWTADAPQKFGDTLITAGLRNTEAFRSARGDNTNFFNIAERDVLMLRRKGEVFNGTGVCIHAFAAGLTRAEFDSLNVVPLPILSASAGLDRSTPYAIAKTSLRSVNDFSRQNDATTLLTLPLGFGRAHSVENQAVVDGVRR